jgi:hypothetical protein
VDNDPVLELRNSSLRLEPGDVPEIKLLRGAVWIATHVLQAPNYHVWYEKMTVEFFSKL